MYCKSDPCLAALDFRRTRVGVWCLASLALVLVLVLELVLDAGAGRGHVLVLEVGEQALVSKATSWSICSSVSVDGISLYLICWMSE